MKTLLALIIISLLSPALVFAKECGVLELGDDSVWDYKNGTFFDIDGEKVASTVPGKKKLQFNIDGNLILIEKSVNKKTAKQTGLKFSIKPAADSKITISKKGSNLRAVFQNVNQGNSFLLLNPDNGSVYRASLEEALGSHKITFVLDQNADFYVYDCSME